MDDVGDNVMEETMNYVMDILDWLFFDANFWKDKQILLKLYLHEF